tara:strand:- start:880 stop:1167 length:288 start_codon:yes stop_codon:yes gene_type:complete
MENSTTNFPSIKNAQKNHYELKGVSNMYRSILPQKKLTTQNAVLNLLDFQLKNQRISQDSYLEFSQAIRHGVIHKEDLKNFLPGYRRMVLEDFND